MDAIEHDADDPATMLLETLRSLGSYRPGIAYIISNTLYLAPSACSPAARTMRSCRGATFEDPQDGSFATLDPSRFSSRSIAPLPASRVSQQTETADNTGFQPLAPGDAEPTAAELASLVDEFFSATGANGEVVFQGNGDPLEAAAVVIDTVGLVAERRDCISFRLNTLGLCDASTVDMLLSSPVFSGSSRISGISVFLPAADKATYTELLRPCVGRGFDDVCAFVRRSAHASVDVEVTAVDRPDVDVGKVEALAMSLGAKSFRTRSWVG